jgi:hypothetical protein
VEPEAPRLGEATSGRHRMFRIKSSNFECVKELENYLSFRCGCMPWFETRSGFMTNFVFAL